MKFETAEQHEARTIPDSMHQDLSSGREYRSERAHREKDYRDAIERLKNDPELAKRVSSITRYYQEQ